LLLLVRPELRHIFGIAEAAGERIYVVEPKLGDAVIFDQRQAGKLYWQRVLPDIAAHRVLDDRDGHEQLRVVHLVIFDELIVAEHRLALQQDRELGHGRSSPGRSAPAVSVKRKRVTGGMDTSDLTSEGDLSATRVVSK
jgi:hypothetical protein